MKEEWILQKITEFADAAHGNQMRKYTPERYIVHPVRVMGICRHYDSRLPVLAAALLHDVVEDTETGTNDISDFLSELMSEKDVKQTIKLVTELTDVYTHLSYPHWNREKRKAMELQRIIKTSPSAQTIKYADIIDNSREIVPNDPGFAIRYLKECKMILLAADKGNPELHKKALQDVSKELNREYNL